MHRSPFAILGQATLWCRVVPVRSARGAPVGSFVRWIVKAHASFAATTVTMLRTVQTDKRGV